MSDSGIPGIIVDRIASGLRGKMSLTEDQVYPSIQSIYIDGQNPLTIQVIPGPISADGGGDGLQTGGALTRRMSIQLTVWYRGKLDMHNRSEQALIEANNGLMDVMEQIRQTLAYTVLGSFPLSDGAGNLVADGVNPLLNSDILKYVGESGTSWHDMDTGVLRRDINFSAAWSVVLAEGLTLGNADVVELHDVYFVAAPAPGATLFLVAPTESDFSNGIIIESIDITQVTWTDINGTQQATSSNQAPVPSGPPYDYEVHFATPFIFPGTLTLGTTSIVFSDAGTVNPPGTFYFQ